MTTVSQTGLSAPPGPTSVSPTVSAAAGMLAGATAMVFVGGSVAVSGVLSGSPLFSAQALRYALACLLLLAAARLARQRLSWPQGREWAWLAGVTTTGLVLFNLALVEGSQHAEPAVLGVAVACVPLVMAIVAPLMEGARPSPMVLLAALVVTCGAALVQGVGRSDVVGLVWAAVVLGCEVGFTLLAVPVLARHGPWGVSVHTTWLATIAFTGIALVREGPSAALELDLDDLFAVGYLAVAVTAVTAFESVGAILVSAGLALGLTRRPSAVEAPVELNEDKVAT